VVVVVVSFFVVVVPFSGRVVVVVVVTSLRGGGEDDEKKKQPDRDKEKKSTAISFCSMGGLTSTCDVAMLSGARKAIFIPLTIKERSNRNNFNGCCSFHTPLHPHFADCAWARHFTLVTLIIARLTPGGLHFPPHRAQLTC
jgi:hypothetical protein